MIVCVQVGVGRSRERLNETGVMEMETGVMEMETGVMEMETGVMEMETWLIDTPVNSGERGWSAAVGAGVCAGDAVWGVADTRAATRRKSAVRIIMM
jgi:hypothetical protein